MSQVLEIIKYNIESEILDFEHRDRPEKAIKLIDLKKKIKRSVQWDLSFSLSSITKKILII